MYDGDLSGDRIVELGTDLQTRFVQFTQSMGSTRIALAVVAVTATTYVGLRLRHGNRDANSCPT